MRNRLPQERWYLIRWAVLERDQFTCRYCGQFAPNVRLEVDHITPVCEDGGDDLDNLVTACWACNHGKEAYRATRIQARAPMSSLHSTPVSDRIVELLDQHPLGLTVKEIQVTDDASYRSVRKALAALARQGRLNYTTLPGRGGEIRYSLTTP